MSRVLILNRYRMRSAAFHRWLAPDHELFLINSASRSIDHDPDGPAIRDRYTQIEEVEDYVTSPAVMEVARQWIREYDIDTIVAFSEYDILRAARLRDEFGLDGQGISSAEAFRDKLVMKQHLSASNIPVVRYGALREAGDIAAFAQEVGYPLLTKPRTGTGSRGIVRIDGPGDAATFESTAQGALPGEHLEDHLVEAYTPHELLHCDGVFAEGRVMFSEVWSWSRTMLDVRDQSVPTVAITLDLDDPRRAEIVRLAQQTLTALPSPGATAFHVEFFDTADGIVVNEAASRVGGGRIQPAIRRLRGIDLVELTARYQVPSDPSQIQERRSAPNGGFLLVYDTDHASGTAPVDRLPDHITHYETVLPLQGSPGETQDLAAPYLLSGVTTGDSMNDVMKKLLEFYEWFRTGVVLDRARDLPINTN